MDEGIDLQFCISSYNPTTQLCMNIHQKNFNKICWAIMSRCLSSTNSTFHNGLRFLHQKPNHWTNLESGIGNVTVGEGHQCCQGLSMTIIPGLEHLNRTWSTFPTKQCCGAGSILTGSGLFSAGSSSYKKWPFNHTFFYIPLSLQEKNHLFLRICIICYPKFPHLRRTNTTILSIRSHLSRAAPLQAANVIANETSYFPPTLFW